MTAPLLDDLARAIARPEPWAPHDALFWGDPWVSLQLTASPGS